MGTDLKRAGTKLSKIHGVEWGAQDSPSASEAKLRKLFETLDHNHSKTVTLVDIRAAKGNQGACSELFHFLGFEGTISMWQMRKLFQQAANDKSAEELNFEQFEVFVGLCKPMCAKLAAEARAKEAAVEGSMSCPESSHSENVVERLNPKEAALRELFDLIDEDRSQVRLSQLTDAAQ